MPDAQDQIKTLYQEIVDAQKKKKEITAVIKEAFNNSKAYHDLVDELNVLRARKKEIENALRHDYASEFNDLDDLKMDIKDSRMVLSDLMWNELMKNNKVEVIDEYKNRYVPQVVVTLKKEG